MLLRRVIQHFRKQEWTAIALDFLIVVVGVFVGLQVNNWNEARGERAKAAFILAELRNDFQALDVTVSHGVCFQQRALEGLQVIAEALKAGRFDPEKREQFENGLRFGYLNAASNKTSGALSEILSSGQMGHLQDPALRAALTAYEGFRDSVSGSLARLGRIGAEYTRSFTDQFDYDLQEDHVRSDQASPFAFRYSAIGDYEFEAMLASSDFREAVFELREVQRIFLEWEMNTLRRVRNIQRLMGDEPTDEVRCL